ncbi:MAG: phosphoglycerate mutase family protein [Candidatus Magasanikbacteria bacterium]|nr:phosphoglycerate mutase family protein [Candidatus Magasanikbacteria bacterium]
MKTVVVVRHGQKDGDALTPVGAMQIFAAVLALVKEYKFQFSHLFYSGANRTWQAMQVAIAIVGKDAQAGLEELLNFQQIYKILGDDEQKRVLGDIPQIRAAGGTVANALELGGRYPTLARDRMTQAILKIADAMPDECAALCFSHSPYAELAAPSAGAMTYAIGEADAVEYRVKDGVIVSAALIPAPMAGKSN